MHFGRACICASAPCSKWLGVMGSEGVGVCCSNLRTSLDQVCAPGVLRAQLHPGLLPVNELYLRDPAAAHGVR